MLVFQKLYLNPVDLCMLLSLEQSYVLPGQGYFPLNRVCWRNCIQQFLNLNQWDTMSRFVWASLSTSGTQQGRRHQYVVSSYLVLTEAKEQQASLLTI